MRSINASVISFWALHALAGCVEDGAVDEEEGGSDLNGEGGAFLLGVANYEFVGAELMFSAGNWRGGLERLDYFELVFRQVAPRQTISACSFRINPLRPLQKAQTFRRDSSSWERTMENRTSSILAGSLQDDGPLTLPAAAPQRKGSLRKSNAAALPGTGHRDARIAKGTLPASG